MGLVVSVAFSFFFIVLLQPFKNVKIIGRPQGLIKMAGLFFLQAVIGSTDDTESRNTTEKNQ